MAKKDAVSWNELVVLKGMRITKRKCRGGCACGIQGGKLKENNLHENTNFEPKGNLL